MTKENQIKYGKVSDEEKKKIQAEIDLRYGKITKELLAIEEDQKIELNKYGGKSMKHKWSDRFSRKNSTIRTIKSLIRYSTQYSKRHKIKEIIIKFRKICEVMSMETHNVLSKIPQSLHDDKEWRTLQKKSINLLRKTQKGLHMRARVKWRQQIKKIKTKKRKPEEKPTRSKTIL